MIDRVLNTIEKNFMFKSGDKVIVAFSGGPDSACLLHLLNSIKEELNITLVAAHVNHCLRGDEADKDEEYVKNFCEELHIGCYSKKIDIKKIAKESNKSCETAGREERYRFFSQLKEELKADKIALAHNANDQAETVIMRIIRGTGMEGLIGIKPVRDNIYVRPIIEIDRPEIEYYCKSNNIQPRTDKTNLENIYTRNKIRLELIPYIQENFNKDIINGLIRLSDTALKDNNYIEKQVELSYKKYCNRKDGKVIINSKAFIEDEAILSRLIRRSLFDICGGLNNFDKAHIYSIINIQKRSTNKSLELPNNIYVYNEYGNIILSKDKMDKYIEKFIIPLNIGEINRIEILGDNFNVTMSILNNINYLEYYKDKPMEKYFDYDKVKGEIIIRNRLNGDKIKPIGMKGSKKLKDLFIDLKINKNQRDKIPLICFGEDIAWVVGYRTSDKFKVTKETKHILEIKIESESKLCEKI